MEIANASLYEGATAVVEAVFMASAIRSGGRKTNTAERKECVLVSEGLHPEYLKTLETYLAYQPVSIEHVPLKDGVTDDRFIREFLAENPETSVNAVVFQSPNFFGAIEDGQALRSAADSAPERSFLIAAVDPIALALLAPPGTYDADIAVGDGQQLGSPLNFGGPSFGFFATRECHVRKIPGRVVGETTDRRGRRGYVLTFQTREQHIRRERATSNICTNQGLCSLRAAMYLTLLGEHGLKAVAEASLRLAHFAHQRLSTVPGIEVSHDAPFFQEFPIRLPMDAEVAYDRLASTGIVGGLPLGRYCRDRKNEMLIACTEMTQREDIERLATALAELCVTDTTGGSHVTTRETTTREAPMRESPDSVAPDSDDAFEPSPSRAQATT